MKRVHFAVSLSLCMLTWLSSSLAQQASTTGSTVAIPHLIRFAGTLKDSTGHVLTGVAGITFSLYREKEGGAALWLETQNVALDANGRYDVLLGAEHSEGVPVDLFTSGEARWLGIQVQGQGAEQPRVLLVSVPYAMKAADAETVGGLPPSAFVMAPAAAGNSGTPGALPPGTITGSGTTDFIPRFTGSTTIGNSNIFETAGGNVGIATTTPAAKLDVKGTGDFRDTLTLFPKSTHPALSVHGTAFAVNSTGLVTFVSGQTFPGTGTVTSVGLSAPASDFTVSGSPVTSSGTLGLNWTVAPTSANTPNAIVKRDGSGNFTANAIAATTFSGNSASFSDAVSALIFINSGAIWQSSPAFNLSVTGNGGGGLLYITPSKDIGGNLTVNVLGGSNSNSIGNIGGATIAGGGANCIGCANSVTADYGTVGGGKQNAASGFFDTVGGGVGNNASGQSSSTVGGGEGNVASGNPNVFDCCATVGGGSNNVASGDFSTVPGGSNNVASGDYSTVPGGGHNKASGFASFAAGAGALATDPGSFVWCQTNGATCGSLGQNSFTVSVLGPVQFYTNTGGTGCGIDTKGNINCSGAKNAVVPIDGGQRKVALSAIESPQNWFEDFGTGKLSSGTATVVLDAIFAQTVNTGMSYHVFLTPKGNCRGLYVTGETSREFVVRELRGGKSNVQFDYRIVARRKGFEAIRLADLTEARNSTQANAGAVSEVALQLGGQK